MKVSKFLILSEDGNIAYSSFTGALAKVNAEFLEVIYSLKAGHVVDSENHLVKEMLRCGFIIDDDTNELALYESVCEKHKHRTDTLKLVIAPTLECNFRCHYCFEEHRNVKISLQVQQAVIDYVSKKLDAGEVKSLSVAWYGGEPLLEQSIIAGLSEAFMKMCRKNIVRYSASIITNGYLIDEQTALTLKNAGVSFAQVTVDGKPEVHNRRRKLNGSSDTDTFRKIIDGINFLGDAGINVSVRINLDKDNASRVDETVSLLAQKIRHKDSTSISPGHVFSYGIDNSHCLTKSDYALVRLECLKLCIKYKFSVSAKSLLPSLKGSYCTAPMPYAFIIDTEGLMYKCWNDVGMKEYSLGTVYDLCRDNLHEEFERSGWSSCSPLNVDVCRECSMLPVCAGGCPRGRVYFGESPACEYCRYILDDLLILRAKGGVKNGAGA